jgi:hypothetical protein
MEGVIIADVALRSMDEKRSRPESSCANRAPMEDGSQFY